MTPELIHEIERLNHLERRMQELWGRGENIPEELLKEIDESRVKIKELQQLPDNQTINK